jgi:hypothetical protein
VRPGPLGRRADARELDHSDNRRDADL